MRSLFTTLRALVMLVSLVGFAAWALVGTEWPAKVLAQFNKQSSSTNDLHIEPLRGLAQAPAFQGVPGASTQPPIPREALTPDMPAQMPQPQLAEPRDVAIMPPQAVQQPPAQNQRPASANVPVSYTAPAPDQTPAPAASSGRRAVVLGPSNDPRDQFKLMERRLRQLGATYYRLETWGDNGEFYRFHCQMLQGDPSGSTRLFEATDREAFAAMTRVMQEVEAWRGQATNAASP